MTWAFDVAARTLCQEVRGEPLDGQQAVAHVLVNRIKDGRWGNNLASVCLWRGQFSGWYMPHDPNFAYACSLPDDDKTLGHMQTVLQVALDGASDFTNGALFYYADYVNPPPSWATGMRKCGKYGRQLFFSDKP